MYKEQQLISTSILKSFHVDIDLIDQDNSTIEMNFVKIDPLGVTLDAATVTITHGHAKQLVPDMGKLITVVADRYNPFDPAHLIP